MFLGSGVREQIQVWLTSPGVFEREQEIQRELARPLGAYTEAKAALYGSVPDVQASLDAGRDARNGFGVVHPRLFHGHTIVNLCHARLLQGRRADARRLCLSVLEGSQESDARAEAAWYLARLSLWEGATKEALSWLERASGEGVRGAIRPLVNTMMERLRGGENWLAHPSAFRVLEHLGCMEGRQLGVSWKWSASEWGFSSVSELLDAAEKSGISQARYRYNRARARCAVSGLPEP